MRSLWLQRVLVVLGTLVRFEVPSGGDLLFVTLFMMKCCATDPDVFGFMRGTAAPAGGQIDAAINK